jgi:hypothetical protein
MSAKGMTRVRKPGAIIPSPSDNIVTRLVGEPAAARYNHGLLWPNNTQTSTTDMEAEQLNSIANRLADIAQRSGELRRYL